MHTTQRTIQPAPHDVIFRFFIMALNTLPAEMVEIITNYLDIVDFRSLRLVNSSLNQQSLHPFKERFFQQKTLTWTIDKLNVLLEIVQHDYFGDALQDLIIDATPRHAIRLWELKKQIQDLPQSDTDVRPQLLVAYDDLAAHADKMATFWKETQQDQKLLTTIFQQKKTLRSHNLRLRAQRQAAQEIRSRIPRR